MWVELSRVIRPVESYWCGCFDRWWRPLRPRSCAIGGSSACDKEQPVFSRSGDWAGVFCQGKMVGPILSFPPHQRRYIG